MSNKILHIAEEFLKNSKLEPHLNCIKATRRLLSILRDFGVPAEWVTYFVNVKHFNGEIPSYWNDADDIEHHCIRINSQILDVTASQFNCKNGNVMPRIYFGQLPQFYNEH